MIDRLPAARVAPFQRQPAQVLYGGAHMFSAETFTKVARIAQTTLATYGPTAQRLGECTRLAISETVYARIADKLAHAALDDYRIDFEDGYGVRSDAEEDGHAQKAAHALMGADNLPPFCGLRIKALTRESGGRALRTLTLFLGALAPDFFQRTSFCVTLPKVETVEQVRVLCETLATVEGARGRIAIELMLELPQTLQTLPALLAAADGRVTAVHFGAYDFLSALNVPAAKQTLAHPLCNAARAQAQFLLGGRVRFSDGATTLLPIAPHKDPHTDDEKAANADTIARAFATHAAHIRSALDNGIYQGWDLHPAQLVPRYAALFTWFAEQLPESTTRLRRFLDTAARATLSGNTFDDAATGQGLLNFFLHGAACGALDGEDLAQSSLSVEQLATRSFTQILRS